MKMRITLAGLLLIAAFTAVITLPRTALERAVRAQESSTELAAAGGGEYKFVPVDDITDDQRARIQQELAMSIERLQSEGKLPPVRPDLVQLASPLRVAAGAGYFNVEAISNYVDQNPAFPNQVRDWNCGARTYDQASGYNHAGIDFYTWPFGWKMLDENSAEIVAAAPGTIIYKNDGQFDRSCGFNSNDWNAVYIRHSDNSVAWYGHMKKGSLTTKAVGEPVALGEKLGIVGSSGNSTGPHLHLEIYNASNQLQDPFQGACNLLNTTSWWAQQEGYRVTRLNALKTHSAPPNFVEQACPTTEITNEKSAFRPGETVYAAAYFRDQLQGQIGQYSMIRPDGTVFSNWQQTAPDTYGSSYWYWTWTLPSNAPQGTWKLRAVVNAKTYETPFTVSTSATVGGRVTTPNGQGLRNSTVTLIDAAGGRRTATTSSFGVYAFSNVPTGASYTITVASKRYRFSPVTRTISSDLTNLDFVGLE